PSRPHLSKSLVKCPSRPKNHGFLLPCSRSSSARSFLPLSTFPSGPHPLPSSFFHSDSDWSTTEPVACSRRSSFMLCLTGLAQQRFFWLYCQERSSPLRPRSRSQWRQPRPVSRPGHEVLTAGFKTT